MQLDANTVLLTILTVAGVVNKILDRAAKKVAANKVEEVKTALEANTEDNKKVQVAVDSFQTTVAAELAEIKDVGRDTHSLVNGRMLLQLTERARRSRALANKSQKPADIAIAKEDAAALAFHKKKQAKVDQDKKKRKPH